MAEQVGKWSLRCVGRAHDRLLENVLDSVSRARRVLCKAPSSASPTIMGANARNVTRCGPSTCKLSSRAYTNRSRHLPRGISAGFAYRVNRDQEQSVSSGCVHTQPRSASSSAVQADGPNRRRARPGRSHFRFSRIVCGMPHPDNADGLNGRPP